MIAPDEYCRAIEAYLCRKNDGHLIRITGPAFETVCGWALDGIPLTVAETGIDRCFERYYRKGPRRRPVRIEFCEADVLEAFDDWRRATGIPSEAVGANGTDAAEPARKPDSLASHVERALARLTVLRGSQTDDGLREALAAATRVLDGVQAEARGARGARRDALVAQLREVDATLLAAARAALDETRRAALAREAGDELTPFAGRMPAAALASARAAALDRLIRRETGLPVVAFD